MHTNGESIRENLKKQSSSSGERDVWALLLPATLPLQHPHSLPFPKPFQTLSAVSMKDPQKRYIFSSSMYYKHARIVHCYEMLKVHTLRGLSRSMKWRNHQKEMIRILQYFFITQPLATTEKFFSLSTTRKEKGSLGNS